MLNVRLATIVGIIVVIVAITGIYFYAQTRSEQENQKVARDEQKETKQSPSPTKAVLPEFSENTLPKTGEGGDCSSCQKYLSGEELKACLAYLNCSP
jgi:flagellar basal body-associated protein FliL